MARSAALIQTEITALESQLATTSAAMSMSSDGTSLYQQQYDKLTARLDQLYMQLERASGDAPMQVRGRVDGLS